MSDAMQATQAMIDSPLLKEVKGFIGGRWVGADSGRTFEVVNPATAHKLADAPAMGRAETIRAIEAAEAALETDHTLDERRGWLRAITDALLEHRDEVGRILTLEQGKPLKEARAEVEYAAGFYRYCAEHIDLLSPCTLEERPKGCRWTVHYRPAGVAGLITPWNFPIAMIAKKLSAALAGGCAAVIKPAEQTPLTMIALFALLQEQVGLPPGRANLVMGPPEPIGAALCEHPAVTVISFTGSTEVGKHLIRGTADQVKKLCLELGGNAPFIVFEDADLDAAADHLMANKFRAGGQTCVCANRVYVQRSVAEPFARKVAERVGELRLGDGMAEGTDIGPLIDRQGFEKVQRHVRDALEKGAKRVIGDEPAEPGGDWGCFFPPTVLRSVSPESACCREETFGPLVPIIEFEDERQAVRWANDTASGLSAYLFTGDDERADRVIARLRFGHVGHNTGTGPTPEAPFGGMKQSGIGREGGHEGLFEFVEPQTVPTRLD